jgi:arabinose-5-phosphate isomerase
MVHENTSLKETLLVITEKKLGVTLISDKKKIVGIFTDGDLRRCLNNGINIDNTKIKEVMTANFKGIESNALAIDAAAIMESNKILSLVVNSPNKSPDGAGVITMHQLLEAGII